MPFTDHCSTCAGIGSAVKVTEAPSASVKPEAIIPTCSRTARHCAGDAAVHSPADAVILAQRHELYHNGLFLVNTSEHQLRPDEGRAALLVHLVVHAPFLHTVAVIRELR